MKTQRRKGESDISFFGRCLAMSSFAGVTAELFTVQFDTAKTRLQMQRTLPNQIPKYRSVIQTIYRMVSEEGARALYYGFPAGVKRQIIF